MIIKKISFLTLSFLFFIFSNSPTAATTINFDDLSDSESLTTQYSGYGVIFTNATALTAGISLNELEFPPISGNNVIFDDGGIMVIDFSSPVVDVGGYFTHFVPISLTAYDSTDTLITTTTSGYSNNLALSGDLGSFPNEFLQFTYAGGISRLVISGDPVGGSFALDDLSFTSPVPEPNSIFLLIAGIIFLASFRSSRYL